MSGAVHEADAAPGEDQSPPGTACVEISAAREAEVGGVQVRRVLPQRHRRTVGAWCFADHAGSPGGTTSLEVGPHPHIGLQTVTWLLQGELLHRDSLGNEQLIRPGQLNLMTAGHAVVHSEEATGTAGPFHAIQLWVAQPDSTRHGDPDFEHHGDLPQVELPGASATVLVGGFGGERSPARTDTEHFGIDVTTGQTPVDLPVRPEHEHGVIVLEGTLSIDGSSIEPGRLAYLGLGRDELRLIPEAPCRIVVLGGVPFPDRLVMWWNYVGRTTQEVGEAHREWSGHTGRFGEVHSPLRRVEVGPPPWER